MKYLLLLLFLTGCHEQERKEVTELKIVYEREDHTWPFKDVYIEKKVMVAKDADLITTPTQLEKVYVLKDEKYIPIFVNILHPTFMEQFNKYKDKDIEESRALIRKIAGVALVFFSAMLVVIGILRRLPYFVTYKGFIDLIAFSLSGIAFSIGVLTYAQYIMYISTVYLVGFIIYVAYSSYRKHKDETHKESIAREKTQLEIIAHELYDTCNRMKSFTKWDEEEKEAIKKIQCDLTEKFVDSKEAKNG